MKKIRIIEKKGYAFVVLPDATLNDDAIEKISGSLTLPGAKNAVVVAASKPKAGKADAAAGGGKRPPAAPPAPKPVQPHLGTKVFVACMPESTNEETVRRVMGAHGANTGRLSCARRPAEPLFRRASEPGVG